MNFMDIAKMILGFVTGGGSTTIIFIVIGIIALPIAIPIIKKLISNYIKEYKQNQAKKKQGEQSLKDHEGKIKGNDKQNEVAKNDAKTAEEDKAKAIEALKKGKTKKKGS